MKDKAKRAKPTWASENFAPPYSKGTGTHKYIEMPKKKKGAMKPQMWTPEDVLKNYYK